MHKLAFALVLGLLLVPAAVKAETGKTGPCSFEENGYSGTLTVDYMMFKTTDPRQVVPPTIIMVVTDREFARIADRLRCRKNATGLVQILGMQWDARLRLNQDGNRMYGRLRHNNQRVHVIPRKDAAKVL